MKSTGIVRRIDELGRVVIPKELRRNLGLYPRTSVEIFIDGDNIILNRYERQCVFCGGNNGDLFEYRERVICKECHTELEGGGKLERIEEG